MIGLLLFLYDCYVTNTPEVTQNLYVIIVLSILYFDVWVAVYGGVLTLCVNTLLLFAAQLSCLHVCIGSYNRYTDFIMAAVIAVITAYAGSDW